MRKNFFLETLELSNGKISEENYRWVKEQMPG
jgi:hypothetical protein